ncbi:MAG: hypothetical protein PUE61_03445 [Clostridiales bacterium]|nr:hypothetical protein [Clostridiales bacterium]
MAIHVDFTRMEGQIKPMHAVNNGPVYKFSSDQRITNMSAYQAAGIPFARTHDASFCSTYGGEHTVDVMAIFPDFDKDPYDPASYDFCLTDHYMKVIQISGAQVFYRLGNKIEHWPKKYGTLPPKDFKKWAVICEHIIRHYNEGWADGFEMNIEYWEIWNEPDLDPDDSANKRCWGGTKKQFFEFYDIAARHLKGCFPHLKIGGPALAGDTEWAREFLAQLKAPLDFFSWHIYAADPRKVVSRAEEIRALMQEYGFGDKESILNEWNYVRGWTDDPWIYTQRALKGLKAASFIAASMMACQKAPVDMLMCYDARPGTWNSLFSTDMISDCLKGYYPFKMFNTLYQLGTGVECTAEEEGIYACAARKDDHAAIMLTHFQDDDEAPAQDITLHFSGLKGEKGVKADYYLLDENHDLVCIRQEIFTGNEAFIPLHLPSLTSYLVELTAL